MQHIYYWTLKVLMSSFCLFKLRHPTFPVFALKVSTVSLLISNHSELTYPHFWAEAFPLCSHWLRTRSGKCWYQFLHTECHLWQPWLNKQPKKIQYTETQIKFLCNTLTECFPTLHILGAVTHFADNVDRAGVQHIEQSGSQTISPVFSQPALTWKDVLDTFGWHGNRQLIHQPAALWCDTVMAKLRGKRRERRWRGNWYITWFLFDLGTSRINYCWARMVLLKF